MLDAVVVVLARLVNVSVSVSLTVSVSASVSVSVCRCVSATETLSGDWLERLEMPPGCVIVTQQSKSIAM